MTSATVDSEVARAAPVLEQSTQAFIDALRASGSPPVYVLAPNEARGVLTQLQSVPVARPAAWLTRRTMQWFWDAYLPNPETRAAITASPLNASLAQLAGLPAALIIVDENDVLRDEGEAYARKLSQAGVCVTSVCYTEPYTTSSSSIPCLTPLRRGQRCAR